MAYPDLGRLTLVYPTLKGISAAKSVHTGVDRYDPPPGEYDPDEHAERIFQEAKEYYDEKTPQERWDYVRMMGYTAPSDQGREYELEQIKEYFEEWGINDPNASPSDYDDQSEKDDSDGDYPEGDLGTRTEIGMLEPVEYVTSQAEIMAKVIALTNDGEFESACKAAAAWGATHKDAKSDPVFWTAITQRAFTYAWLGVHVQILAPGDRRSAKEWFFSLCGRATKMRGAQERLDVLQERIVDRDNRMAVLVVTMAIGPQTGHMNAHAEHQALRLNLIDPLHPGVPLERLVLECRILLVWTKKALAAKPFDIEVYETMLDHWQHVTTPSDPPLDLFR